MTKENVVSAWETAVLRHEKRLRWAKIRSSNIESCGKGHSIAVTLAKVAPPTAAKAAAYYVYCNTGKSAVTFFSK